MTPAAFFIPFHAVTNKIWGNFYVCKTYGLIVK